MFITLVPKVLQYRFLVHWGYKLILIGWLIKLFKRFNHLFKSAEWGGVHKFIGHCLIPLDP